MIVSSWYCKGLVYGKIKEKLMTYSFPKLDEQSEFSCVCPLWSPKPINKSFFGLFLFVIYKVVDFALKKSLRNQSLKVVR